MKQMFRAIRKLFAYAALIVACPCAARADYRIDFTPHGGGEGKIFLLGDGNRRNPLTVKIEDGWCWLNADYGVEKKGARHVLPDAVLTMGGPCLWKDTIWGRPNPSIFCSTSALAEHERALLDDWTKYPAASERRYVFDFVDRDGGGWDLYVNGAYLRTVVENALRSRFTGIELDFPQAWGAKVDREKYVDTKGRFRMCDFSLNPKPGAFRKARLVGRKPGMVKLGGVPFLLAAPEHAGDVGRTKELQGNYQLEVNPYLMRTTHEAYPFEVHFRVRAADFVTAHILFALNPDPDAPREMTVRLARYFNENYAGGTGSNAMADTRVVCEESSGLPKGATKVGNVQLDGRLVGLYRLAVPLDVGRIVDLIPTAGCLDLDFLGVKRKSGLSSAFTIFGATLEASPFDVVLEQGKDSPGNVFAADEPTDARKTSFRLMAREAAKGTIRWTARDDADKIVLSGEASYNLAAAGATKTIEIPLGTVGRLGVYRLHVDFGHFAHQARFCVVPSSKRDMTARGCPFGMSAFSAHMARIPPESMVALHRKAGVLRTAHWPWREKLLDVKRDGLLPHGQVYILNHIRAKFDPKTETFGIGEEKVLEGVRRQVEAVPFADTVLIWHETEPRVSGVPVEVLGSGVPPPSDEAVLAGKYVNACGKLLRRHFPQLKIQIGNTGNSFGAATIPFRGGANPEYYDYLGIEWPGQATPPEIGLAQMQVSQRCASRYANRPISLNGCYEFTYRSTHSTSVHTISEEAQARFYMRDILLSLIHGFRLINPGVLIDARNTYFSSFWGSSGFCMAAPSCYPKLSYLSYAVLTKMLDGAVFTRFLDTGSSSVYAAEFKRADGRFATVFWCRRGEGVMKIGKGDAVEAFSMRGKSLDVRRVDFGEEPSYVISRKPLTKVLLVDRSFRLGERLYDGGRHAVRVTTENAKVESVRFKIKPQGPFPAVVTGVDVTDPGAGRCLEIAFDMTKTNIVYAGAVDVASVTFKEPIPLPVDARVVGLKLKGNSNGGHISWTFSDAAGVEFRSYSLSDAPGFSCVDYDGWGYVYYPLDRNDLLFGSDFGNPGKMLLGRGVYKAPLKLKGISIEHARRPLGLKGFGEAYEKPKLRLAAVFAR